MNPSDVACIILASGLSRRYGGGDKLKADLCGKSVLSHVMDMASQVGFGEKFLVSNDASAAGFTQIRNDNPEAGQGYALRLGLRTAREAGWESCLILLGDMPVVKTTYLKKMILKYNKKQSIISVSESIRMPPALLSDGAANRILSEKPTDGARELFDSLDHITVEMDAESALDVDTPADLARVRDIMKAREI